MATAMKRTRREAPEEPLATEERAFLAKRAQLLRLYEGQFVALYQGRVAGHGMDEEELALRMFTKLGNAPFYITKVEREPTIYELPSPETVR